ncbi:hypothetical protein [Streptomyces sp. NPDC005953]|uniref:hypothetical protein n=1 Tax=Streptomyces sp. NPDC005953 TaxID=3156719 RepID=UPI0033DB2A84
MILDASTPRRLDASTPPVPRRAAPAASGRRTPNARGDRPDAVGLGNGRKLAALADVVWDVV